MKPLLQNIHIAGQKIGDWQASVTPDGTIAWSRPKKMFRKESLVGVYATPHYDKPNVVSVDVVKHDTFEGMHVTMSTSFNLKGEFLESDLKMYLVRMESILGLLK